MIMAHTLEAKENKVAALYASAVKALGVFPQGDFIVRGNYYNSGDTLLHLRMDAQYTGADSQAVLQPILTIGMEYPHKSETFTINPVDFAIYKSETKWSGLSGERLSFARLARMPSRVRELANLVSKMGPNEVFKKQLTSERIRRAIEEGRGPEEFNSTELVEYLRQKVMTIGGVLSPTGNGSRISLVATETDLYLHHS